MRLAEGDLPNGSVLRVTVRQRGARVSWDLMRWGKELGGDEEPRPGIELRSEELMPYDDAKDASLTSSTQRLDVSKL